MKLNVKKDNRFDRSSSLAGGAGLAAATQDAEGLLRRAVLANLLWENVAYEDGESVASSIISLVPRVAPETVAEIAIEARTKQKLRRVPLLLAREMARLPGHKALVADLLPNIILRPDEITEFVALYWKDGKEPFSRGVKKGLARAFERFDEYALAKYNRDGQVKLRDVLFLVHPKPPQGKEDVYKKLADNTLETPDTWEVALSGGGNKKDTWTRLISEQKLGALAFVRNLRNMLEANVPDTVILEGFKHINPSWLLPMNYLVAARHAPRFERELEGLMFKGFANTPKLPGHTIFVVDVSGSMGNRISEKSELTRFDVATAMAMLASETCERISLYATAGNDNTRQHATSFVRPRRGFALVDELRTVASVLGGGGIFTRQCLAHIQTLEGATPERVIVFSDSQDCDRINKVPSPFGKKNYIVDVSANTRGINYQGVFTAEISGWSEHFLSYIMALEGITLPSSNDVN